MTAKSKRELRDERARAEAEAEDWNARNRVGQAVEYQSHPEAPVKVTHTRSRAHALADVDGERWRAMVNLRGVQGSVPLAFVRPCPSIGELMGQNSDDPRVTKREHYRRRLQAMAGDVTRLHERFGQAYAALAESRNLLDFQHEVRGLARDLESIADAAATLRDDVGLGQTNHEPTNH